MPSITRVYHVNSVPQALARAKRELGDEALLLSARAAKPEERSLGAYVVSVAVEVKTKSAALAARPHPSERMLADLKSGLRGVVQSLESVRTAPEAHLAGVDLPPDVAERWRELASRHNHTGALSHEAARKYSFPELVPCDPGLSTGRAIFIGPAGTGKTSLLAKVAFRYGLQERKDMVLISTDVQRVARGEVLRAYSSIFGVPLDFAETPSQLVSLFELYANKDLVLVDTPGGAPKDRANAELWTATLATIDEIDVHLVLNAQTRTADQLNAIDRWARSRPTRLAFTHMDEAGSTEGIVAAAARSNLPVSFLGVGQSVPEDLEQATPKKLYDGLFAHHEYARAAAQ